MNIERRRLFVAGAAFSANLLPRVAGCQFSQEKDFYAPTPTGVPPGKPIPRRFARTTILFKSAPSYPNALTVVEDGLWVAEQRQDDNPDRLWLFDWDGNIKQEIQSDSKDTSGLVYGNGNLWICANDKSNEGIYQADLCGHTLHHRQIPLGPPHQGGGSHGAVWHDGHLWASSNRERAILKIEPDTWTVDFVIPFALPQGLTRYHGCAVLGDSMYMISGGESRTYTQGQTNLIRYDLATGTIQEIIDFLPGSCDPHGLSVHDGKLISCDSGDHPGWDKPYSTPGWGAQSSPTAGSIFRIELDARPNQRHKAL